MPSNPWRNPTLLAVIAVLALAACDDDDDPSGPGDDVFGVWELNEPEDLYLDIRTDRIIVYDDDDAGSCFDVFELDVLSRDGDMFVIDDGGTEADMEIRRQGDDGLVIDFGNDIGTYTWAGNVDLDDLNRC